MPTKTGSIRKKSVNGSGRCNSRTASENVPAKRLVSLRGSASNPKGTAGLLCLQPSLSGLNSMTQNLPRTNVLALELPTYLGVPNWPAEVIFDVFGSTNRLSCASPGLLVRGSGFSNPRERSGISIQGFSPGGGASNSISRDADDHANSSGLSLKPALSGFSQM